MTSEPSGYYAFTDILGGDYILRIDEASIPSRYKLYSDGELPLSIHAKSYQHSIHFGFIEPPKKIIIKKFPKKDIKKEDEE
jgi:hypothetical protein